MHDHPKHHDGSLTYQPHNSNITFNPFHMYFSPSCSYLGSS